MVAVARRNGQKTLFHLMTCPRRRPLARTADQYHITDTLRGNWVSWCMEGAQYTVYGPTNHGTILVRCPAIPLGYLQLYLVLCTARPPCTNLPSYLSRDLLYDIDPLW